MDWTELLVEINLSAKRKFQRPVKQCKPWSFIYIFIQLSRRQELLLNFCFTLWLVLEMN